MPFMAFSIFSASGANWSSTRSKPVSVASTPMFPPAPFSSGPKTSMIYLTMDEGRLADQNSLMIKNTKGK